MSAALSTTVNAPLLHAPQPLGNKEPPPNHARVLIVEDDRALLDATFALLSLQDYALHTARCGREAIATLGEARFEVVLLDLELPDIHGIAVLDRIRELELDARVIIVSGHTDIDAIIATLKRDAFDFVRKPYPPGELLQTVENAIKLVGLERQNAAFRARLAESEALHRFLVDASPDMLMVLESDHIAFLNERGQRYFTRKGGAVGHTITDFVHPEDHERLRYVIEHSFAEGDTRSGLDVRMRGGEESEWRCFELAARAIDTPCFGHLAGHYLVARDITERKAAEAQVAFQAFHDALTGLPNRMLFIDRLGLALLQSRRAGRGIAVMFIDLDRFKIINDSLGHAQGDELLKQVAARLHSCLRRGDTLARVGGDEFLALLPEVASSLDAEVVAEKMVRTVSAAFTLAGTEVFVSASIGIALFPEHGESIEELVRQADMAMYAVKAQGKNAFGFYDHSLAEATQASISLELAIRQALHHKQFRVHYQAQYDTRSMSLDGLEALLRWEHPERGLISPNDFIPFAEEIGLINELSAMLVSQVLSDMHTWLNAGYQVPRVALNVSAQTLEHSEFVDTIIDAIHAWNVPPELIELEVTESACIRNPQELAARLTRLVERGVQLAIDDFGMRYSTMTYLQWLPVNTIKVDRSFVQEIHHPGRVPKGVLAILAIARGLKLRLIAEGVETEQQRQALEQEGCYLMQGYLLARPLPAAETLKLLRPAARLEQLQSSPPETELSAAQ